MDILPFLFWPFVASLILTGIHAYLGVHVVERGVIFVDLALAQIAALGATIAILLGMDPHGRGAYFLSLGFTFLGRASFPCPHAPRTHPAGSFYRHRLCGGIGHRDSGHEQGDRETEHLKDMLVGNILAVSRAEVVKTALLYGAIGLFHYIFRKKFLLISTNLVQAEGCGMSIRLWTFCSTPRLALW